MIQNSQQGQNEVKEPVKLVQTSSKPNSYNRDLKGLKQQMAKRNEQRALTLYYLTLGKHQNALIFCRQLTHSSHKVYQEYFDDYNEEFEEVYFTRTSKAKEHLQYLLDNIIACKVYSVAKKKEDSIDVLEKVEIQGPALQHIENVVTNQDKIKFNEIQEIHSKMCAVLLSFIQVAKTEKLNQYCEKFFQIYVNYVKKNYGIIEYSTAIFKYANYLYEIGKPKQNDGVGVNTNGASFSNKQMLENAEKAYLICCQIRKKNVINICYIDSLLNLAICQRELSKYPEAIKNTEEAIQIHQDVKSTTEGVCSYYLFLAKLNLEYAMFQRAFECYKKCYKYREHMTPENPLKIQIELNIVFFLKSLTEISERHKDVMKIQDKKILEEKKKEATAVLEKLKHTFLERQQFSKYRDFKTVKQAHLTLNISKQFFDTISAYQIWELEDLLKRLNDLTYARGLLELSKCTFYEEKKTRDLLIEMNPQIKKTSQKATKLDLTTQKKP